LPNRKLISIEGVVQQGDANAESGGVAVLAKLRVLLNGKEEIFTAVHAFYVVFDENVGRRLCVNFSGLSGLPVDSSTAMIAAK
jgi:hypothetical protein